VEVIVYLKNRNCVISRSLPAGRQAARNNWFCMQQIKDIKAKDLVPGITGYYAHGNALTLGYVEIKAGAVLPEHHHVHEQITYIIEGQLDMVIDGKPCPLKAGMYYVIPSNVPHSAVARMDCKVIDVFNPVREDYKPS
jgi:quercetin dioxygenase-like cupin family protein